MEKKNILYFILVSALIQLICQLMYKQLDTEYGHQDFIFQYVVNLPASIFIGVIDFLVINVVYKRFKWRDNGVRILIDLVSTSVFVLFFAVTANYILSPMDIVNYISKLALPLLVWNTIIVLLIEVFFYNQRQAETEKKLAISEKERVQYQYETLKAQINPHFLFNSLNVLSSLAYQDAEKANLFTKKLSGVYRYLLLTNNNPTVTVSDELFFLDSYLYLEKIRFEDAFSIIITKEDDMLLSKNIIPVSLQLLTENALKHNVTTQECPLQIRIEISNSGISVINNIQPRNSVEKGGVGLINLEKQYALYGAKIEVIRQQETFIVRIPFI